MDRLTTNYATPYALIKWGGCVPGQRPRAKMAFIRRAIAKNGQITHYLCRSEKTTGWSKTDYKVLPDSIIKTWRNPPTEISIQRVKQTLKPSKNT